MSSYKRWVNVKEPFHTQKRTSALVMGDFVAMIHLASITSRSKEYLIKKSQELGLNVVTGALSGDTRVGFLHLKDLGTLLECLGWVETEIEKAKLMFQVPVAQKKRPAAEDEDIAVVVHPAPQKKPSIEVSKQPPALQVVPKKKFGSPDRVMSLDELAARARKDFGAVPERVPTIADHARIVQEVALKARAEMDAQLALMKPKEIMPDWAASLLESQRQLRADFETLSKDYKEMIDAFKKDRDRKINEELKDVLPALKQRLELRALEIGLEEKRRAIAEAKDGAAPDWVKEFIARQQLE